VFTKVPFSVQSVIRRHDDSESCSQQSNGNQKRVPSATAILLIVRESLEQPDVLHAAECAHSPEKDNYIL
jgi:hypothetical protein